MKIVKSASHYTEAARDEVQLLTCARDRDPQDAFHCCRLLDHFDHVGPHGRHVCMLFEVLGDNLLALIRAFNHRGIPMPVVRHLAKQTLEALNFLHTTCGIIHTDLKPENLMMKEPLKERAPAKLVETSTGVSGAPSGKIAAALAAGQPLTKNQKKKLRKKHQQAKVGGGGDEDDGDDGDEDAAVEPSASGGGGDGMSTGWIQEATDDLVKHFDGIAGSGGGGESREKNEEILLLDTVNSNRDGDDVDGEGEGEVETAEVVETTDLKALEARLLTMNCKIVDFGNACWVNKHFTEDIQTRQYRAPEVGVYFFNYL